MHLDNGSEANVVNKADVERRNESSISCGIACDDGFMLEEESDPASDESLKDLIFGFLSCFGCL